MTTVSKESWVIDSGATCHMSPNREWMTDFSCHNQDITVADNSKISSNGVGNILMNFKNSEEIVPKTVKNVIHVPNLATNLLSVSKVTEKGYVVTFDKHGCKVYDENLISFDVAPELTGTLKEGVYTLDHSGHNQEQVRALAANRPISDHELWHRRLGHLNRKGLKLLKGGLVKGIVFGPECADPCVVCLEGKQTVTKFLSLGEREQKICLN